MIQRFDGENWGVATHPENNSTTPVNTKKRENEVLNHDDTIAKKPKRTSLNKDELKRPREDHTIYGKKGIMRGILRYKNKAGVPSYAIDDNYQCRNAKVFGDNGIAVGTWFPQVLAALRDGCHGL